MSPSNKKVKGGPVRPDVFGHHDYRVFLKAWLDYRKRTERGFSLRSLARDSGFSAAYLPLVFSEARALSADAWSKMAPNLGLNEAEREYLGLLRALGEASTAQQRLEAVARMQKMREYRKMNPGEVEAYRYLSHWYYVVIRELAATADFSTDPDWIRKKLSNRVTAAEAREAIAFLMEKGYLEPAGEGRARQTTKNIEAVGGVYKVALGQFHKEMFQVSGNLVAEVASEKRNIQGYTFAFPAERFEEVRAILNEAMAKIEKTAERVTKGDEVYHVGLFAVPLTSQKE
jgi:uncharacterized protein (TIGR02147 family)